MRGSQPASAWHASHKLRYPRPRTERFWRAFKAPVIHQLVCAPSLQALSTAMARAARLAGTPAYLLRSTRHAHRMAQYPACSLQAQPRMTGR